ncbi:MAG: PKD domain-containing protein [Candidatus Woesebacteria bacterium]|jgi:hypothetical protein
MNIFRRTVKGIFVGAAMLSLVPMLQNGFGLQVFANGGSIKTIYAKALSDHECNTDEWHFVINQVEDISENAPGEISVKWTNGNSQSVSLSKTSGHVAHYTTYDYLDSSVSQASAVIYDDWGGQFNLSHGPCGEEPTPTPTEPTETPTESPTETPTESPTETPTESPTETPTQTPTESPTETPTETVSPSPTPEVEDEFESRCVALSASPTEGTVDLTVRFTGSGFDSEGDIQGYRFDFGDTSGDQPQVVEQESSEAYHRYEHPGSYVASLSVKDSRGDWKNGNDDCKVSIEAKPKAQILSEAAATELPKTGPATAALGLIFTGPLGLFIYRRFRLV